MNNPYLLPVMVNPPSEPEPVEFLIPVCNIEYVREISHKKFIVRFKKGSMPEFEKIMQDVMYEGFMIAQ